MGLRRRVNTIERFFSHVNKLPLCITTLVDTPCWIWTACLDRDGYGIFGNLRAHRFSWELVNGPIPDKLIADHLCRILMCVNPDHLEPVTVRENTLRGKNGRMKTHCSHGHEYTEDNLICKNGPKRKCRTCNNEQQRERIARKRAPK